jgi:hypothetical protein
MKRAQQAATKNTRICVCLLRGESGMGLTSLCPRLKIVNEGTDIVVSSIIYTLGSNVENLTLFNGARDFARRIRLKTSRRATGSIS